MNTTAQIGHKNLIVYQKAKQLSKDIVVYFSKNNIPHKYDFLVNQLLRANTSTAANIAEGYGRQYQKSLRQFLAIARGSSFETDYWLEVMIELQIFDNKTLAQFSGLNLEIIKMLSTLMKNIERRQKQ